MASLSFNDWDLEKHVADAIGRLGWEEPTQIQLEAIPFARKGMDVVGQARTGSGKTAAFGLALLNTIALEKAVPQSMVICPTRELAEQVAEEIRVGP